LFFSFFPGVGPLGAFFTFFRPLASDDVTGELFAYA
jgi:hypothetical protein